MTNQIDICVNKQDEMVYFIELINIGDAVVIVDTKNKRIRNLNLALKKILLKSFKDDTAYIINIKSSELQILEEEPRKVIIEAFEKYNNLYSETVLQ